MDKSDNTDEKKSDGTNGKRISVLKLYGFFTLQMISLIASLYICVFYWRLAVLDITPLRIDIIVCYLICVCLLLFIAFSKWSRTTIPVNIILFVGFTLVVDYLVGLMNSHQTTMALAIGIISSLLIFVVATIFAWLYIIDVTLYGGFLIVSIAVLLVSEMSFSFNPSYQLAFILGILNVILTIIYTVYATQTVISPDVNFRSAENDYMFASTFIFLTTMYNAIRIALIFSILDRGH